MTAIELQRRPARDAFATRLMERFRRTGSREVFDALFLATRDQLLQRVRARTRYLGGLDPHEVLQDAYINIYRYPDRFNAARPSAFRAWSSAIVDNAVRRHLRGSRARTHVHPRGIETFAQQPDRSALEPDEQAMAAEEREQLGRAFRLLLALYLAAFQALTARERLVLQLVEVEGKRYTEAGSVVGKRPEALKMVVFRARRRIFERLCGMFPQPA